MMPRKQWNNKACQVNRLNSNCCLAHPKQSYPTSTVPLRTQLSFHNSKTAVHNGSKTAVHNGSKTASGKMVLATQPSRVNGPRTPINLAWPIRIGEHTPTRQQVLKSVRLFMVSIQTTVAPQLLVLRMVLSAQCLMRICHHGVMVLAPT